MAAAGVRNQIPIITTTAEPIKANQVNETSWK